MLANASQQRLMYEQMIKSRYLDEALITELMVKKAQLELFATTSGHLRIICEPETVVVRGQVIGHVELDA